ncbi:MAG: NADH-quinone oxidoreductase subunit H, partial [Myxococcota bacterium]
MVLVIATIIKFIAFPLTFVLLWASLLTLLERRQSAYSQDRYGPTRAHFFTFRGKPVVWGGVFHIVADALKMFFKETTEPDIADKQLFRLAPMVGFVTSMVILALIPFGPDLTTRWGVIPLQIARVDSG